MTLIRCFTACELAPEISAKVCALMTSMRMQLKAPKLKWVRPVGLHITLKFYGEVTPGEVEAIIQANSVAIASAIDAHHELQIKPVGLGGFPALERARVLWLGIRDKGDKLSSLQREIDRACEREGLRRERRPFHPHLTLARTRNKAQDLTDLAAAFSDQMEFAQAPAPGITLFRSTLKPGGAVYEPLYRWPLSVISS